MAQYFVIANRRITILFLSWLICGSRGWRPADNGGNRHTGDAPFKKRTIQLVVDEFVRKAVPNAVGRCKRRPGENSHEQDRPPTTTKSDLRAKKGDDPRSEECR